MSAIAAGCSSWELAKANGRNDDAGDAASMHDNVPKFLHLCLVVVLKISVRISLSYKISHVSNLNGGFPLSRASISTG